MSGCFRTSVCAVWALLTFQIRFNRCRENEYFYFCLKNTAFLFKCVKTDIVMHITPCCECKIESEVLFLCKQTAAGLGTDVRALAPTTHRCSHSSPLIHICPSSPYFTLKHWQFVPICFCLRPIVFTFRQISLSQKDLTVKPESLNETVKDKQFRAVCHLKVLLWSKHSICNARVKV